MENRYRSRGDGGSTGDNKECFKIFEDKKDSVLLRTNSDSQVSSVAGDESNIAILLFLYILQGIPLGLAAAVPLILTNLHATYQQQAQFSFAFWPFSIKLLWAPLVDTLYFRRFGRRKTWLVPVQYAIGLAMIVLSYNVNGYLDRINVGGLTTMFFALNFLAATQDIAVDGWALTMLKPQNVGYASTCNSVGQTAGYFMGYVFYMALESYGLMTLADFLFVWAIIFFVSTTLIALFKNERPCESLEQNSGSNWSEVMFTYKQLWNILQLPFMPIMVIFLLTCKIGFSATDAVTGLKLIEAGVPKETLTMLGLPLIPLQIILPWVISRYMGSRPLDMYIMAMSPRLFVGLIITVAVYCTPFFKPSSSSSNFSVTYYALIMLIYAIQQVFSTCMFVSIMAFFAQISDPLIGGTYMTLLNTLTNLGGNWPATLALWLIDLLTYKQCHTASFNGTRSVLPNLCSTPDDITACEAVEGSKCVIISDGYYVESVICCLFGFIWLHLWGKRTLRFLQNVPLNEWRLNKNKIIK